MRVGYRRVSSVEQKFDRQELGELDKVFEEKVSALTMEIKLKDMEIKGLQDDIADVRFLYRQQLDSLLEEKAASSSHTSPLLEEPSEPSSSLQEEETM